MALRQPVGPDTVFDVAVGLNTIGQTPRWTWINGVLVSRKPAGLRQAAAEIHLRLKPAVTPDIDWSQMTGGCTATPIFNCEIPQARAETLSSSLLLSLDSTLDPALTGAVFATQGAVAGFLLPGGTPDAPTLDLQIASAHLGPDGAPLHGVLQAFLPAQALINLYGVLPADASTFFTATRVGDPGTQDAPLFQPRTASDTSSDGLFVTIGNISFSSPTYRVARKGKAARVHLSNRGSKATLTLGSLAACRRGACTFTVYRTTPQSAKPAIVASGRTDAVGAVAVLVKRTKSSKGSTYLIAVRQKGKLVSSGHVSAG